MPEMLEEIGGTGSSGLLERVSTAGSRMSRAIEELDRAARLLREAEEQARASDALRGADERLREMEERYAELAEQLALARTAQVEAEGRSQVARERTQVAQEHAHAAEERLKQALERTLALETQLAAQGNGRGHERQPHLTVIVDGERDELREAITTEIRRPLSAILGLTLALKHAEPSSTDGKNLIRQLGASARRLERLIGQMTQLEAIANGSFTPSRRRSDLEAIVRRVVEETPDVADRDVRVSAEHVALELDPALTEQMVESLLANAARRTMPGAQVWVKVSSEGDGAVIAIDDACPDVPATIGGATPPARVGHGPDARRKTPRGATGLVLLSRLAQLHGGRAWVEERPGGGASFRVFLPGASREPQEAAPDTRVTAREQPDELVVDTTPDDGLRELSSFDAMSNEIAI